MDLDQFIMIKQIKLLCALALPLLGLGACSNSDQKLMDSAGAEFRADTLKWNQVDSAHKELYFLEGEDSSRVVQRHFAVNQVVQVQTLSSQSLQISSFSVLPLHGVQIWMQLQGYPQEILVGVVDSLPALSRMEFTPAIIRAQDGEFWRADSQKVHFAFKEIPSMARFRLQSQDPHFQKLSQIKCNWQIGFKHYSGDQWRPMNWLYAKEWTVIVQNLAYLFSTPRFKEIWDHWALLFGGDLFGNDGNTFSAEDYAKTYQMILNKGDLQLGVTAMGGGLGGGNVWGVDTWNYYSHYASYSGIPVISHEFAHTLGFGHSSALAADGPRYYFQSAMAEIHDYFNDRGDLPYLDPTVVDFANDRYKPYRYNGVDLSMTKVEKESELEVYFKNHPTPFEAK